VSEYVVDASAIIALARGEKGFERVEEFRERSVVSAVNLMEAFSRIVRHDVEPQRVHSFLRQAFPIVIPFDREQSETAAIIHAGSRNLGLSHGDAACLALGSMRKATVLTGDRAWKQVDLGVKIMLFR
jgi:PIN domain nuclease of toxin-antitoxin system